MMAQDIVSCTFEPVGRVRSPFAATPVAVVMLLTLAVALNALQPSPRGKDLPDTWLDGTIGTHLRVRMYVGQAGYPKEEGLWGAYFYRSQWTLIPLEGARLPSGMVRLYEGDPSVGNHDAHAMFDLNITQDATVSGTWTSADGARRLPVRLRRIAQPPTYAEALTNARTFADPRWPFRFKYPADWFLRVTSTTLLLQSPDPFDMLVENRLECERGERLPSAPAAARPPVHFKGSYYRAHHGWEVAQRLMQSCDEPDSKCDKPNRRTLGAAIMLDTDIGYRSYNPWGYSGVADANEYLVIAGREWAHCTDRALDSPNRIQPR